MNATRKIVVLCGSKSDFGQITSGMALLRVAEAQGLTKTLAVEVCSAHRNPVSLRALLDKYKFAQAPEKPDVVIVCAGKLAAIFGYCDAISRNEMRNDKTHFIVVPLKGKTAEASQAAYLSATQVPDSQFIFQDEFFHDPDTAFEYAISGDLPKIVIEKQKLPQTFTLKDAYHEERRKYPEKASYSNAIEQMEQCGFIHHYTGKTRETFVNPEYPDLLYILTTDRISIFDIVLNATIPGKGAVLTAMTVHWLRNSFRDVPNHLVSYGRGIAAGYLPAKVFSTVGGIDPVYLMKNMLVVKRTKVLKVEAIVRGYLTGSGLKDYRASGSVCGIALPQDLVDGSELPDVIFTPSTKADYGLHDQNISFGEAARIIGEDAVNFIRDTAIHLYLSAREKMRSSGIIIADTKFEFGIDSEGNILLIDEVLTPDSSRFWPEEGRIIAMTEGKTPPSFDKQPVRIAGESAGIKTFNPEWIPEDDLIARTKASYQHMIELATGKSLLQFWRDDMRI